MNQFKLNSVRMMTNMFYIIGLVLLCSTTIIFGNAIERKPT